MKILAVYGADFPWDIRVEKLLSGLHAYGHEPHLLCRNLSRALACERVGDIICHRVLGPGTGPARFGFLSMPAPANPLWRRALVRVLAEVSPDLMIVRDLPLSPLVIAEARRVGLPVIVDMAENHPAMWKDVAAGDPVFLRSWLVKNPILGRRIERQVVRQVDAIFVVVEEMRRHILALGAPPEKVHVVSNTPPLEVVEKCASHPEEGAGRIEMVYVGYIDRVRGLQHVIEAMAILSPGSPPIRLHVIGTGDYLPNLKDQVRRRGMDQQVIFHGWVDQRDLPAYLSRGNLGLVPHLKTEHTDTTVPNKLFDYMAAGIPVLVSDAAPLARIVGECRCGLIFPAGRPGDLAERLQQLTDPSLRGRLGARGREAIRDHFHWERDLAVAAEIVGRLGRSRTACDGAGS